MSKQALIKVGNLLSELDDDELLEVISHIHHGWIKQKYDNDMRAVDFETGIANLIQRRTVKNSTYKSVLERWILPHKRWLRAPWIIERLEALGKDGQHE